MSIYKAFFQLKDSPFRLTPDPNFLYMTVQHREALSGLVHSICNHSGLTVLVGEAGTGKTTLIQVLRTWLERLNFSIVTCTNPILSREELYDMLVMELDIDCASSFKNRQLMALDAKLREARAEGRRSLLIVDEAHRLPSDLLEEIRLLLNLETTQDKLLEILLVGQPELMAMLRQTELRQLKQRVSSFCRLQPLSVEELREYVHHRLAHAGLIGQTLFADDTFEMIHAYSQGIPRVVNTLCESALLLAFAVQSRVITRDVLGEAALDMDLSAEQRTGPTVGHSALKTAVNPPVAAPAAASVAASASTGVVPVPTGHIKEQAEQKADTKTGGHIPPVPLEGYATRQKSLGFLAGLMDRWK